MALICVQNVCVGRGRFNARAIKQPQPSRRYEGVYSDKTGKWVAQLGFNGKQQYLGSYDSEDEAGMAVRKAQQSMVQGNGRVDLGKGVVELKAADPLIPPTAAAGVKASHPQQHQQQPPQQRQPQPQPQPMISPMPFSVPQVAQAPVALAGPPVAQAAQAHPRLVVRA